MLLFFFLSGIFFETTLQRSLGDFPKSRFVQILWPLVLWAWIFFGFKVVVGRLASMPSIFALGVSPSAPCASQ